MIDRGHSMRLRLMNYAVINVTRCHVYLMNPHIICTSLQSRDAIMQFLSDRSQYFCKFRCDISVESRKERENEMSLKSADLSWTLVPKKIVFVNR